MIFLRLSYILVMILALSSCGDDEESCTQLDWIGIYTGTVNCDGFEEEVTVTIAISGTDKVRITYESPSVATAYEPLAFEDCDINRNDSAGGTTITIDASLDVDNLTISEVISTSGTNATCTITATRQ